MPGSEKKKIDVPQSPFINCARHRQKGTYAIEFALVFILFFVVLYGMITYGLIFAAQQSLKFAANSGARASLQWQEGDLVTSLDARASKALEVAGDHIRWIDQLAGGEELRIFVCSGDSVVAQRSSINATDTLCKFTNPKRLEVIIQYSYLNAPMIPPLMSSSMMSIVVPTVLEGRASIDLSIAIDHPEAE